jgi:hypothetical protein
LQCKWDAKHIVISSKKKKSKVQGKNLVRLPRNMMRTLDGHWLHWREGIKCMLRPTLDGANAHVDDDTRATTRVERNFILETQGCYYCNKPLFIQTRQGVVAI